MENSLENKRVELGQEALGYLDTTRKWTMFFAILGFVFMGLMLVASLAFGSLIGGLTSGLSNMEGMEGVEGMDAAKAVGGIAGTVMFVVMLIFAVIYFFPLLYLFRYSRHSKKAVAEQDANELTLALKNMKMYWKYIGILVIIMLAVYLIFFIIFGASMAFLSGLK
jgi:heme/copper-type cytochrome/quinol oxidase subunit 2